MDNGWNEYQKLVMDKLDELPKIDNRLRKIEIRLAMLTVRVGVGGGAAGGLVVLIFELLKG